MSDPRKRVSDPNGKKESEPGIVEPWPELSGGSKNLNCRWIFGFAELIVGSESVGSAAKVLDLHQKSTNPRMSGTVRTYLIGPRLQGAAGFVRNLK